MSNTRNFQKITHGYVLDGETFFDQFGPQHSCAFFVKSPQEELTYPFPTQQIEAGDISHVIQSHMQRQYVQAVKQQFDAVEQHRKALTYAACVNEKETAVARVEQSINTEESKVILRQLKKQSKRLEEQFKKQERLNAHLEELAHIYKSLLSENVPVANEKRLVVKKHFMKEPVIDECVLDNASDTTDAVSDSVSDNSSLTENSSLIGDEFCSSMDDDEWIQPTKACKVKKTVLPISLNEELVAHSNNSLAEQTTTTKKKRSQTKSASKVKKNNSSNNDDEWLNEQAKRMEKIKLKTPQVVEDVEPKKKKVLSKKKKSISVAEFRPAKVENGNIMPWIKTKFKKILDYIYQGISILEFPRMQAVFYILNLPVDCMPVLEKINKIDTTKLYPFNPSCTKNYEYLNDARNVIKTLELSRVEFGTSTAREYACEGLANSDQLKRWDKKRSIILMMTQETSVFYMFEMDSKGVHGSANWAHNKIFFAK
jgi:hypothetical protein